MAMQTFSIRMDDKLKKEFEELCDAFGMNMTTAINVFARKVVQQRKIPFEITETNNDISRLDGLMALRLLREEAKKNGTADMSLEEINEEIAKERKEK